jgi:hypothetical protein
MSLDGGFAWVTEVLSCGQLERWGKTPHSTQRRTVMPSLLREDLEYWREILIAQTHASRHAEERISAPAGITC